MLIAAQDKYGDGIDVDKRLEENGNEEETKDEIGPYSGSYFSIAAEK